MDMGRTAIALALLLAGCGHFGGSDTDNCACTALFAMVTVEIVDAGGQPVTGLTTRTVFVPTGQTVAVSTVPFDGTYVIADDNSVGLTDEDGELFRFEIVSPPVTRDYLLSTDACSCHIGVADPIDPIVLP